MVGLTQGLALWVKLIRYTAQVTTFKVPIMSKTFFRSSNSTFHLKNFFEQKFQFG